MTLSGVVSGFIGSDAVPRPVLERPPSRRSYLSDSEFVHVASSLSLCNSVKKDILTLRISSSNIFVIKFSQNNELTRNIF